jgi:hypothetical protein
MTIQARNVPFTRVTSRQSWRDLSLDNCHLSHNIAQHSRYTEDRQRTRNSKWNKNVNLYLFLHQSDNDQRDSLSLFRAIHRRQQ